MSEDKGPWWYPKPVTDETVKRLRDDYPEDTKGMDDEEVLARYELEGCRYQWLWDHTGEAADQANHLADEIFRLEAEADRLRLLVRTIVAQANFTDDQRAEYFKLAGIEQ